MEKIERFFVDERGGCIAVRDTAHPEHDPEYQGLHYDTPGVIWYRHGVSEGHVWNVANHDRRLAAKICEHLNSTFVGLQSALDAALADNAAFLQRFQEIVKIVGNLDDWPGNRQEAKERICYWLNEIFRSAHPGAALLADHRSQIAALEHLVHKAKLGAKQHTEEIKRLNAEVIEIANHSNTWRNKFRECEAERDRLRKALEDREGQLQRMLDIQARRAALWAIDWIGKNVEPVEVYNDSQLEAWARDNGYVREDEQS